MKTIKLWIFAVILTLCGTINSLAQNNIQGEMGKWTFIGNLTNPDDTLFIYATDNLKEQNIVVKENGSFKFTTNLTDAKSFFIISSSVLRKEGGFTLLVEAVPGEVLVAEGFCDHEKPADGLTFSGSKFYEHYTEAHAIQDNLKNEEDAQQAIDFIKAHPDSEVAVVLVNAVGCNAPNRLDEMLALLSPEIRNGRLKGYIDKEIEDAKAYVKMKEMEGKTLPMGSVAPDFTLNDLNGKPLKLSSLRGKYVVLDFWGSWCGWCIKGFPEMKKYYEKYKDKMEILGMDCNDTEEKWKKAVADNELPWQHVFIPKRSQILSDYMITVFPTKIIINPDGNVLMTFLGEDSQFYELLDEIFK